MGWLGKNNYTKFKFQWENILWQMLTKFLNTVFSRTVISEKLISVCSKNILPYSEMHIGFFSIYKVYTKKHTSCHAHVVKIMFCNFLNV